jgi:hypothetical protein
VLVLGIVPCISQENVEWWSKPQVCIKINTTVASATPSEHIGISGDDEDEDEKKRKRGGGPMELAKIPSHAQTVQYCADADEKVKDSATTLTKIRNDETRPKKEEAYALCSSIASRLSGYVKVLNRDHGISALISGERNKG